MSDEYVEYEDSLAFTTLFLPRNLFIITHPFPLFVYGSRNQSGAMTGKVIGTFTFRFIKIPLDSCSSDTIAQSANFPSNSSRSIVQQTKSTQCCTRSSAPSPQNFTKEV